MSADQPEFDWLSLDGDEELLWSSRPHRSSLLPALLVGIPLSVVLVGIPIVLWAYLRYRNTNFVVTDAGVYVKTGVLSRDVKQVGFDKVQNTSYRQGALGASLGYGTVDVSTAGTGGVEIRFRDVPDPASVQELVNRQIQAPEPEGGSGGDLLQEVLEELQAIRGTLETQPRTPER